MNDNVILTHLANHSTEELALFGNGYSAEDDLDVDCDGHLCNMRRRLQQVPVPPPQSLSTPCPAPRYCLEMPIVQRPCDVDS